MTVVVLTLAAGCGGEEGSDGGTRDASASDGGSAEDASPLVVDAGDSAAGSPGDGGGVDAARDDAGTGPVALPPANAPFDYQLGGAYSPPDGVAIVSRDRADAPVPGIYSICYVNGFQTQPDERAFWERDHPDLLLRDESGDLVIDPDWDEFILDVTTAEKRRRLATIVEGWIDGCADDGFDAIEIDNLDTYSRSGGRVSQDNAVEFMRSLSDRAHARGLAIAQKNSTEVLGRRSEMGTDFAISEECNRYTECGAYTDVYGDLVLVIEYSRSDFTRGCSSYPELSIVLRDLLLRTPSHSDYVYDGC